MLPEGKNLRDMLSAGQRTAYEAALAKLKMPPQAFDRLEPWFAGLTLSVIPLIQSGYKTDSGVEKVLEGKAGTIDAARWRRSRASSRCSTTCRRMRRLLS